MPSAAAAGSRAVRELTRGVLRGLLFGRPVLGDVSMRGFVWVAHSALAIARLPITAELTTFWRTLDRAALAYVGEEYPRLRVTRELSRGVVRPASVRWRRACRSGALYAAGTSPG